MQVKRFVAADMRRALELVREKLGPEAVILSSSRTSRGVEILTTLEPPSLTDTSQPRRAYPDDADLPMASDSAWQAQAAVDLAVSRQQASPADPWPNRLDGRSHTQRGQVCGVASGKTGEQLAMEIERARERMLAARRPLSSVSDSENPRAQPSAKPGANRAEEPSAFLGNGEPSASFGNREPSAEKLGRRGFRAGELEEDVNLAAHSHRGDLKASQALADSEQLRELKSELADMRQLLEEQLGHLVQGQPRHHTPRQATLWRRFSDMGLPPESIEPLVSGAGKTAGTTRAQAIERCRNLSEAWRQSLALLAHQLPVAGRDVVDAGGIFAFVGPTGVGKTTTIGKLAARYVLRHGADQVALVTTDTYRIAAHDQLRSLGRILNVPVRVVDDNHSLPRVLNSLRHCSLVLIDTAGFRHGDPILKEQLNVLRGHRRVKNYLVLSCNSQVQMMKASMHAYQTAGLSGCVLTKLDETASLGETLGIVLEHRLPVAYTANGQDIPRDIEVCRAHNLVSSAVRLMKANLAAAVNQSPEQRLAASLGRDSAGITPRRT